VAFEILEFSYHSILMADKPYTSEAETSINKGLFATLKAILKAMRPRQWTKNAVVFAALVFDRQLLFPGPFLRTLTGFVIFCLLSGVVYIINDIADVDADRNHPKKRLRPIAAGQLPLPVARAAVIALIVVIFPISYLLSPGFMLVALLYLLVNLAYSQWIKHIPLLDVFSIAAGFVLRVAAGVMLIQVARFSPWLYVVTTLGSLYIGFGKRRAELALLADGANSHRRVLDGYTIPLLDQFIIIVSSVTIIAYSLYTFSAPNLPENHAMMLTIPFVLYGIFRYLYLIQMTERAGAPEEVLLSDRPLQIDIVLWGLSVLIIFYLLPPV
jgi:4-hydroxybenzoate polyprenyltransferase